MDYGYILDPLYLFEAEGEDVLVGALASEVHQAASNVSSLIPELVIVVNLAFFVLYFVLYKAKAYS